MTASMTYSENDMRGLTALEMNEVSGGSPGALAFFVMTILGSLYTQWGADVEEAVGKFVDWVIG